MHLLYPKASHGFNGYSTKNCFVHERYFLSMAFAFWGKKTNCFKVRQLLSGNTLENTEYIRNTDILEVQ